MGRTRRLQVRRRDREGAARGVRDGCVGRYGAIQGAVIASDAKKRRMMRPAIAFRLW